jgi:SAM-dependent methyltransferase
VSLALLRIWRAPAVQALLLQCAAVPATLLATYMLARAGVPMNYAGVALLQGVLAAALTWWRRLARWWRPIQLLFPLALVGAQACALPSWLFLAAFLFLLLLYWSTFRTQVPYYPSGRRVWDAVHARLPQGRPVRVIDIGSGLGGFAIDLAARRLDAHVDGIELAPLPWLASRVAARLRGSRARFILGDYDNLDFARYDAIFCYLSPAAMSALYRKAAREMRPGSMLMSYEFTIAERPADDSIVLTERGTALFVWHF